MPVLVSGARGDARARVQPVRRPGDHAPRGAAPDRPRARREPSRHARRPGVFGPGNRANATLGRAVRLCLWNLAAPGPDRVTWRRRAARPVQLRDRRARGRSPWGRSTRASASTPRRTRSRSFGGEGPHNVNDHVSQKASNLLTVVADTAATLGTNVGWYSPRASFSSSWSGACRHDRRGRLHSRRRPALRVRAGAAAAPPGQAGRDVGIHDWPRWMETADDHALLPIVPGPGRHLRHGRRRDPGSTRPSSRTAASPAPSAGGSPAGRGDSRRGVRRSAATLRPAGGRAPARRGRRSSAAGCLARPRCGPPRFRLVALGLVLLVALVVAERRLSGFAQAGGALPGSSSGRRPSRRARRGLATAPSSGPTRPDLVRPRAPRRAGPRREPRETRSRATAWQWRWTWNPFAFCAPASSAVRLFQMTDAAFAEGRQLCIHAITASPTPARGTVPPRLLVPALYLRTVPAHAIEMTAAPPPRAPRPDPRRRARRAHRPEAAGAPRRGNPSLRTRPRRRLRAARLRVTPRKPCGAHARRRTSRGSSGTTLVVRAPRTAAPRPGPARQPASLAACLCSHARCRVIRSQLWVSGRPRRSRSPAHAARRS